MPTLLPSSEAIELDRLLRREWLAPPDRREIWEWIAEEGELPSVYAVSGRLDIETCPMIKEPMRAWKDYLVRKVTCMCAVQCLKTLTLELCLLWSIAHDSGSAQWLHPTDKEAKEHADERFTKLIESFPAIQKFYTDNRHDKTGTFINFIHMFLRMEGANVRANLQRKSIKLQFRSEIWQSDKWERGRLKEADSRQTQFVHNSKAFTESQPGWDKDHGGDDMHAEFSDGTMEEWNFRCQSCGKLQPYLFDHRRQDGTFAGIRWDDNKTTRRDNGEIREAEMMKTVRCECLYCGERHYDDPLVRRRMQARSEFVAGRPDVVSHRSFNWNQFAMTNLSWWETKIGGVKNFLQAKAAAAKGNDQPLMDFWMKVAGQAYNPAKHAAIVSMNTVEISTDSKVLVVDGTEFHHRLGAIDVQQDYFRVVVEAYSKTGDSITLFVGTCYTWEDCHAVMQKYDVPEPNVSVDGSHRGFEVRIEACKHGYATREKVTGRVHWRSWLVMIGDDQDVFIWKRTLPNGQKEAIELPYQFPGSTWNPALFLKRDDPRAGLLKGKYCEVVRWSNPTIKDIVINRRDGRAEGCKVLVARGDWNDLFNIEMHSQKKVIADTRYARSGGWKWVKFRDDHSLDCVCMNTVRAIQLGCFPGYQIPT